MVSRSLLGILSVIQTQADINLGTFVFKIFRLSLLEYYELSVGEVPILQVNKTSCLGDLKHCLHTAL